MIIEVKIILTINIKQYSFSNSKDRYLSESIYNRYFQTVEPCEKKSSKQIHETTLWNHQLV